MKTTVVITLLLISLALSKLSAQDIGSSWKVSAKGVHSTSHELDCESNELITWLKMKQRAIVYTETKVNPNLYSSRIIQFINMENGEVLFQQDLVNGELNTVIIPLKQIKAKYGKSLAEQTFCVVEKVDGIESGKFHYYRYKT